MLIMFRIFLSGKQIVSVNTVYLYGLNSAYSARADKTYENFTVYITERQHYVKN